MSGWAPGSPEPPAEVPGNAQGLWRMPATPAGSRTPKKKRGHPDCIYCTLGETGCCSRHSYDAVASLGIARPSREDRLESSWRPV